jgi:hypothetical protein
VAKAKSDLPTNELKRSPQGDAVWEADFRALPKPVGQTDTHYVGFVVAPGGHLLAERAVPHTPASGDLAQLLTDALLRPLHGYPCRPRTILVRKNPRWRDLFPALADIGIEVATANELTAVVEAYDAHLRRLRAARSAGAVKPTAVQTRVETLFPAVARWVGGYGHIEIGEQDGFGFVVRAVDAGGVVFEDDTADTLAAALAALERGLTAYFDEEDS